MVVARECSDRSLSAKYRADLPVRAEETAEGARYVVQNPDTGRFVRLGELEHFVARQLDGTTPLEEIQRRVTAEFGGAIETAELAAFVKSLAARGLLDMPDAKAVRHRRRHQPIVRGSPLYLRFKAFDPDMQLTHLEKRLWFCFTRGFVHGSVVVIALAVAVFLADSDVLLHDIAALFTPETLLAAWLVILATGVVHEYAHGITCKHFGGRVREMGFMLIFFQPALYCNVSDAWLFPEKRQRLWVTAAGIFVDLLVWAVATLAWRLFAPETTIHFIATVIAATAGIRCFFNLNPLIKLDGYYLLSDWLDIANLRQRATDYAKARLSLNRSRARAAKSACPPRERRILFVYGCFAAVFTIWFLSFIVSRIGAWLVGELQGWGFLLLCVFLWLLIGRRLLRLFGVRRPAGADGAAR